MILSEHLSDTFVQDCYNLKTLGLVNEKNLVLGLTQENSIENSVQNCLPYILRLMVHVTTAISLP